LTDPTQAIADLAPYRRAPEGTHPPLLSPDYASTVLRAPKDPLIHVPQTLTEITGPLLGEGRLAELDHDLTRQHQGEPLGERIIVHGRVLDGDGRPIRNTLVEVWRALPA
jgi:protocatechuate 3,4-dioxygenase beta subunit